MSIEQTLETSGEHTKSLEEMEGTDTTTGAFAHQYMQFYVRKIRVCSWKKGIPIFLVKNFTLGSRDR